jgi:hypothetical protein
MVGLISKPTYDICFPILNEAFFLLNINCMFLVQAGKSFQIIILVLIRFRANAISRFY